MKGERKRRRERAHLVNWMGDRHKHEVKARMMKMKKIKGRNGCYRTNFIFGGRNKKRRREEKKIAYESKRGRPLSFTLFLQQEHPKENRCKRWGHGRRVRERERATDAD